MCDACKVYPSNYIIYTGRFSRLLHPEKRIWSMFTCNRLLYQKDIQVLIDCFDRRLCSGLSLREVQRGEISNYKGWFGRTNRKERVLMVFEESTILTPACPWVPFLRLMWLLLVRPTWNWGKK